MDLARETRAAPDVDFVACFEKEAEMNKTGSVGSQALKRRQGLRPEGACEDLTNQKTARTRLHKAGRLPTTLSLTVPATLQVLSNGYWGRCRGHFSRGNSLEANFRFSSSPFEKSKTEIGDINCNGILPNPIYSKCFNMC